ncbi:hypothetical protein [Microbacterium sp. 2FI]|uniref:hypothetical protein n=1 Tax=Microbacterium sp. 2FI TaxID=2502193 RepID=UPI0010F694C8|nr:hypothetical protein [Microbacterium sp. 2FI]
MSMVTIGGVRYRVDDAKRRGLLAEVPAVPAESALDPAPASEPEPVVDGEKPSWWAGLKGGKPKNKAAKPADK